MTPFCSLSIAWLVSQVYLFVRGTRQNTWQHARTGLGPCV